MLTIVVPARDMFDEKTEEFYQTKECKIQMEHSLVSISKWESKWHKPFLSSEDKTQEEFIDYIKCMTITQNVDPIIYRSLTKKNIDDIYNYIEDPMTATTFKSFGNNSNKKEIITSEIIYYQMIGLQIPFECQKWHLNRLLALIRVCAIKNQPPKKMKTSDAIKRHQAINEMNKARFNTKG